LQQARKGQHQQHVQVQVRERGEAQFFAAPQSAVIVGFFLLLIVRVVKRPVFADRAAGGLGDEGRQRGRERGRLFLFD